MSSKAKVVNQVIEDYIAAEEFTLNYKIIYCNKKNLSIQIKPDASVLIRAPVIYSLPEIKALVRRKLNWIKKKRQELLATVIEHKYYQNGECFDYLGDKLELNIVLWEKKSSQLSIKDHYLMVFTHRTDSVWIEKLLYNWYQKQGKLFFNYRIQLLLAKTTWVKQMPPLKVSKMKTRWGSCSSNGRISLNSNLLKAPIFCVDYVILHELCHLQYMNHSKAFYQLLALVMPNWQAARQHLKQHAQLYLN